MKCTILIFFLLLFEFCNGQKAPKEYIKFTKEADSLYNIKEFEKAGYSYSKAFDVTAGQGMVRDRYKSACCWALSQNADSAFFQLYRIAVKGKYAKYEEVLKEPDFFTLQNDVRWMPLIEIMKKTRKEFEDALNSNGF